MKYRRWNSKTKARIVLEGLENKVPLAEICSRYQICQNQYYYWLNELETKAHEVFESAKRSKKEKRLLEENKKLKQIIAEPTIELKKTELELEELNP